LGCWEEIVRINGAMAATVQDVTTEVSIAPQTEEDYEAEVLVL